jgi:predicted O-linked N-acetylglucosamine transferase (SPINDLY family)
MKGYNFNSRCGESINNNMDLANLIANDKNDYVNIALNISKNINKLALLRKKIFQNAIQSPLFNTKNFSKNFFDIVNYLKNKS